MNAIGHRAVAGPQPPTPWQSESWRQGSTHGDLAIGSVGLQVSVWLELLSAGTSILVLVTNGGFPPHLPFTEPHVVDSFAPIEVVDRFAANGTA
jgi:hypothetical protein